MAPFGETTSGAEIVAAFPEQIEGKTCQPPPPGKSARSILNNIVYSCYHWAISEQSWCSNSQVSCGRKASSVASSWTDRIEDFSRD